MTKRKMQFKDGPVHEERLDCVGWGCQPVPEGDLAKQIVAEILKAKDAEITRLQFAAKVNGDEWKQHVESAEAKLKQIRELIVTRRGRCSANANDEWQALDDLLRALDAMETK